MTKHIIAIFAFVLLAAPAAYGTAVDEEGRIPSGYLKLAEQIPLPPSWRLPAWLAREWRAPRG